MLTEQQQREFDSWQDVVRNWPDDINNTMYGKLLQVVKEWGEQLVWLRTEHTFKNQTYLVMVDGYWGRGPTVKVAAERCLESGGKRLNKALVKLVIGDTAASITSSGMLERAPRSEVFNIGHWFKLGDLLRLESE